MNGSELKEYVLAVLPFVVGIPLSVFLWATYQRRKNPPSSEMLEAAAVLNDRKWLRSGRIAMIFLVVYVGAYSIRRVMNLPHALDVVLILVPLPFFYAFMSALRRESSSDDELTRRVVKDAVFEALVMFMTIAMGMWLLDEFMPGPRRGTYSLALGFLPLAYLIGLSIAKGRYMPATRRHDATS